MCVLLVIMIDIEDQVYLDLDDAWIFNLQDLLSQYGYEVS